MSMLDVHSHILPEVDDGSNSMSTTLEMLRMARLSGTNEIIATPHYCRGYAEVPYKKIINLVNEINNMLDDKFIDIKIYPGQEVYYDENIITYYKEGIIGTLNNSNYMLIEFSMAEFDEGIFDVLYELELLGIRVIIAHPERYMTIIKNPTYINKFIDEGYLFQMNAGSLVGIFGKEIKRTCEVLLKNNIYSLIGSDAHNINSRTTDMSKCRSILEENYEQSINIFRKNGKKLINNEEIFFLGNKIIQNKKSSLFSFFRRN